MTESKLYTVHLPFPDKEDRQVWIYVPKHIKGDRLPVIYMTDGQNLFDKNSTPHGCWEVAEAVENEIKKSSASTRNSSRQVDIIKPSCPDCFQAVSYKVKKGAEGAVIVGIDNGNIYRDSELTPKSVGEVQHRDMLNDIFTPQGEIFDGFLMNTVVPFVEENYPVRTDRQGRAICGSSSGGLMAFFSGIEHSDFFSFIGAFSPAFLCYTENDWRSYLLKKIRSEMPYLYIYTGGGDELEQMIFESVEMMYDLLPEVGYPYDMLNEVVLFENEHNEKAWREIFPDFLHTFSAK